MLENICMSFIGMFTPLVHPLTIISSCFKGQNEHLPSYFIHRDSNKGSCLNYDPEVIKHVQTDLV